MGSLRALLCSSPSTTAAIKEESETAVTLTKNRVMKRAAFEEWHTKKFLSTPSSDQGSATLQDDENQPLDLIKRFRDEASLEKNAVAAFPADVLIDSEIVQRNFALCLRMLSPDSNCHESKNLDGRALNFSDSSAISDTLAGSLLAGGKGYLKSWQDGGSSGVGCARAESVTLSSQVAKRLTAPKLSRHNDAAYYPNIQCILCKEWVCSRNRYMHIESHLQYRPYKCSVCGYDNRKEIFINLHIKKTHGGAAAVDYRPDPDLEHRAWIMAEQCLQHTRDVLQKAQEQSESLQEDAPSTSITTAGADNAKDKVDEELLLKYASQYRPRLYNSQRAEKSLVIEGSLKMGIVPDFTEVSSREIQCQICESFVISHAAVMEEHARSHLSLPSYRCSIDDCSLEHNSKNFLTRHMKEVHKYRRSPFDMTESDIKLKCEFLQLSARCFPGHFTVDRTGSQRRVSVQRTASAKVSPELRPEPRCNDEELQSVSSSPAVSLSAGLSDRSSRCSTLSSLLAVSSKQPIMKQCSAQTTNSSRKECNFCQEMFDDNYSTLYRHAKQHLSVPPYECSLCKISGVNRKLLLDHIATSHSYNATLVDRMNEALSRQCVALFSACFPGVPLQPALHDPVLSTMK